MRRGECANVDHDFNNPTGAILGEAYLAASDMQPNSPRRDNIEIIQNRGTRLEFGLQAEVARGGCFPRHVAYYYGDVAYTAPAAPRFVRLSNSRTSSSAASGVYVSGCPARRHMATNRTCMPAL